MCKTVRMQMGARHWQSILSKPGQAWLGDSCVASVLLTALLQPLPAHGLWDGSCLGKIVGLVELLYSEFSGFPCCHWWQCDASCQLAADLVRCHGRFWSLGPFCSSSLGLIFASRFQ